MPTDGSSATMEDGAPGAVPTTEPAPEVDSDSDVEYFPEGSDGSCDEYENLSDGDDDVGAAAKRKGKGKGKGKGRVAIPKLESDVKDIASKATASRYVTRSAVNDPNAERHTVLKDEAPDESKTKRIDDLWASFKQTPKQSAATPPAVDAAQTATIAEAGIQEDVKKPGANVKRKTCDAASNSTKRAKAADSLVASAPKTVEVCEKFDFAGKEVVVTKTVDATSREGKRALGARKKDSLDDILSGFEGKKSMNVLTKSGLDWDSYKKANDIDSTELRRQNMDGYIERQGFLARTNVRQWERESAARKELRGDK